jgi:hypothetical protein
MPRACQLCRLHLLRGSAEVVGHCLGRQVGASLLFTPFHNMALMCPDTTGVDIDRHTDLFAEVVGTLLG